MGVTRLINCPACKFANRYGDAHCVVCKGPLPRNPNQPTMPAPTQPKPAPKPPAGGPPPPKGAAAVGVKPPGPPKPKAPAPAPANKAPAPANIRETQPMKRADPLPVDDTVDEGKVLAAVAGRAAPTSRLTTLNVDKAKIVAWMCCDPLPPIPLGGKPVLTIGRHHDCDLVLPHKEVSRRHAVVKVRATTMVLEDEGSSNGCFVNGNRMNNGVLRVGDVITIGPYEVEIKSNEEMLSKDERSDTKTNLELTSASRLSPAAGMTGKLQDMPLAEILQGIEFNKKSGTLVITLDKTQQGTIVAAAGAPQIAMWGDLRGDEAVLRMLTLFKGRFTFSGAVEPCEREMKSTFTALLLEASRRIDEGDTAPTDQGNVPRPARDDPDEEDEGGDFDFS